MTMALPRSAARIQVSNQAGLHLARISTGRAERAEKAEGKIKEHGTAPPMFSKLLLSAHWLGEPGAAPCFWTPRAAILRKPLALLGFDRHHGRRTPDFLEFLLEARS